MKNKRTVVIKIIILGFMIVGLNCKKFITVDLPVDRLVSANVFTSDASALAAVSGIYSSMMGSTFGYASAGMTLYPGLSSDEFDQYSSGSAQKEFILNALTPSNTIIKDLWSVPYNHIFSANAAIEGLQNSNSLSTAIRNSLTGEAKFIRAFSHFYLVNLFGEVPVVTSLDFRINTRLPRSSKDEVYQQILKDLKDAQNLLPADYSLSNNERTRPNKWAATALLARVYLYMGDYVNAELQATALINATGQFSLIANINNVFLKNSMEAIWQLMPVRPNLNTNEGRYFILTSSPATVTPGITISNGLLAAFEPGDNRKLNWINKYVSGNDTWYYPYKYKIKTSTGTAFNEYYTVFRLAEIFLIRAEARAQQNKFIEAIADINAIRQRAGLPNTTAGDKASTLLAIEQERRVELFAEWGHRWFDLKRTNRAGVVLAPLKSSNWQITDLLYPLPQNQMNNDQNIVQNPGY